MAAEPAEEGSALPGLPESVRQRVVALASDALDGMLAEEVPLSLRAFRRFAAPRRARLAASPVAAAVERDEGFRRRVAVAVREALPELASAVDSGAPPVAADPRDVAALAFLLRPEGWPELVGQAAEEEREQASRTGAAQVAEALERAQEQLATLRAQARADHERARAEVATLKAEVAALRHGLHDARSARREAQDAARAAAEELEALRRTASAGAGSADAELRRARARVTELEALLDTARRAAREGRAMGDARVRLLLDTLVEAGVGLRRELALPPSAHDAPRPADAVAALRPDGHGVADVAGRAREADDPALLDQLLALPRVHLVVDGYNVTKLGYGSLPLRAQRDRLLGAAGGLAARSSAEVTVVFDGAEVQGRVPVSAPRGVRVLFSLPGETADDLVRRIVANEPPGRPVVVVSSDREVADGVRASGARPIPSAALLRLLARC